MNRAAIAAPPQTAARRGRRFKRQTPVPSSVPPVVLLVALSARKLWRSFNSRAYNFGLLDHFPASLLAAFLQR